VPARRGARRVRCPSPTSRSAPAARGSGGRAQQRRISSPGGRTASLGSPVPRIRESGSGAVPTPRTTPPNLRLVQLPADGGASNSGFGTVVALPVPRTGHREF